MHCLLDDNATPCTLNKDYARLLNQYKYCYNVAAGIVLISLALSGPSGYLAL